MKRIVLLIMCLFGISVSAQQVTQEQLAGTWKAIVITQMGCRVDLEKKEFTMSEDFKEGLEKDRLYIWEETFRSMFDTYEDVTYAFKEKGRLVVMRNGEKEKHRYTLSYREGKSFLTEVADDSREYEVRLTDGILVLYMDTKSSFEMKRIQE